MEELQDQETRTGVPEDSGFRFGVSGLDSLLVGGLRGGSLLVVAGHPGAGKTTLGASLCAANALEGRRCIYFSVQEPREKLYANLKRVGLDLEGLEERGLLRFVKLPLVSDGEAAREVLDEIGSEAAEYGARVVVVDSVTPILKAVRDSVKSRSVLQEFFATLPLMLNGIVVLLAEIPIIEERVELGDIEFVADTILLLTHRVEKNRLIREIIIRKARGSPLTIAKVPFAITAKGLKVYTPPNLETIPALEESKKYKLPCDVIAKYTGSLFGGTSVYISYPPDARPPRILGFILLTGFINNAKLMVITFRLPPSQIKRVIFNELVGNACPGSTIGELERYIKEKVEFLSYNPSAFSLEELYSRILFTVDKIRPDIVSFLGSDVLLFEDRSQYDLIMNLHLYFKLKGILLFNLGAHASDLEYNVYSRFADVVARYIYYRDPQEDRVRYKLYLWRVGLDPRIIPYKQLEKCNMEMASITNSCRSY
ncbi:MAG: AAA family ATPase [Desulfurococcales archaeon]|nr:AAA family ATPase [Desulfurococcales archaeon]